MHGDVMRVLMTADAVGGVWTYALELASALAHHQVHTTVATMGPLPSAAQLQDASAIPGLNIVTSEYRLEWMDDPWADVAHAGQWLLELEAAIRPDVIHLNGFAHGALPWRAPVVVVGHSCVLSWADAVPNALDPDGLHAYREAVTRGLQAADRIVAVSHAMASSLERHYGPFRAMTVVHNGRSNIGRPARKEPLVFTAGRLWDAAKNVAAVVDVAPSLAWPVVIAGPGEPAAPADPNVTAIGAVAAPEIGKWLSRASIVALPARYEPFGLLPLEAALAGCALVLGDLPSLREVWGDAATFVDPNDRNGLRTAIGGLIESPALLTERARAARDRARAYSPGRMAQAYLDLYRELVTSADTNRGRVACAS